MITLNRLTCIRTEDINSSCRLCVQSCQEGVFSLKGRELKVTHDSCTDCGACIGLCPTHALSLDTKSSYLWSHVALEGEVSCKKNAPCLAYFSSIDWCAIGLFGENIEVMLGHCSSCELNKEGFLLENISSTIDEANRFLEAFGRQNIQASGVPNSSRRNFFSSLSSKARQTLTKPPVEMNAKAFIRSYCKDNILEGEVPPLAFLGGQKIDSTQCSFCLECVTFCPTGALFRNDEEHIAFDTLSCIQCGLCHKKCQEGAITSIPFNAIDLTTFHILAERNYVTCKTCKTTFHKRGEQEMCTSCVQLKAMGLLG